MRNWGIMISALYALILVLLIIPGGSMLGGSPLSDSPWLESFNIYEGWITWVWLLAILAGQAALLFLSVDTSRKRLKPQRHILVSLAVGTLLTGLLTFAAAWSLTAGIWGDNCLDWVGSQAGALAWTIGLWALWGIIFYLYTRKKPGRTIKWVGWLIKGSVLELLVAVPCHIITRHREDCCAPAVTGFGIATGIAIMLLAFGPSVLLLYSRRLKQYKK